MRYSYLILGLISSLGFAESGMESAQKLCQTMSFQSETMKCTEIVQGSHFFEPNAVEVCTKLSFPSQQRECLEKIRNKVYDVNLVNTCKEMTFPSKILECFGKFGTVRAVEVVAPAPAPTPTTIITMTPNDEVRAMRKRIKKALKQLDKGNYFETRRLLLEAVEGSQD